MKKRPLEGRAGLKVEAARLMELCVGRLFSAAVVAHITQHTLDVQCDPLAQPRKLRDKRDQL